MARALAGGLALGFVVGWNVANTGAVAGPLADADERRRRHEERRRAASVVRDRRLYPLAALQTVSFALSVIAGSTRGALAGGAAGRSVQCRASSCQTR